MCPARTSKRDAAMMLFTVFPTRVTVLWSGGKTP